MQIASGYVQGKLGTVQNALEHQKILGDYFLDVISHKYLVVIKLNLALDGFVFVGQLGKIENTLEVEGVICVDVDPEQRLAVIMEHLAVELLVVLIGAFRGGFQPKRCGVVDGRGGFVFFLLIVLALCGEVYVNRHERAVFL